ncbi:MAG: universal stress protein [Actinomycetota bacterium]|nr:universal stress protein [Actinomycetota bacterium]
MDTVLVAVDGSPSSRAALDWALERAGRAPTSLRLVTVVWTGHASFTFDSEVEPLYERVLLEAEDQARTTAPGVQVTTSMLHGVPAAELVQESEGASMLVVGTDKSTKMAGIVYGTLPLRVAAKAHCPVVVVPRTWQSRASGPVVLGVGDEDPSREAADFAAREALVRQTPLELLHVWASSPIYPVPVRQHVGHLHDSIRHWHEEVVTQTANAIRGAFPGLEVTERLVEGPRIPHIIEEGERAQLLVVGRRGGIFRGLVLGSAAHDVLMNPPCPVAVVPVEEHSAKDDEEARAGAEHVL